MSEKPKPKPKPRRTRHAATLADVGREAGVSAMAASAVLNGATTSSRISQPTRERIQEAAAKLRYRPNATARGLADRRMNTIGVATTFSANELNQYFLEVFNGVIEGAAAAGQNTTVFALTDWPECERRLPAICDGRIDGLILLSPWLSLEAGDKLPDHTPFVSVHANQLLPGVTNIESDEEAGAFEMTRQLLALGHRRILHLAGPPDSIGAQRRVAGYLAAHAAAGVPPAPGHVQYGHFTTEAGRRAFTEWLLHHQGQPMPEAIFGATDSVALVAIDLLVERGLRVPQDVSVVGFDDTLAARSAHLTTVRQPLREMGLRAVELLVQRIEAKQQDKPERVIDQVVLRTEFVKGRTLAKPRKLALLIA
jgi:LacI family transcriptional regulator